MRSMSTSIDGPFGAPLMYPALSPGTNSPSVPSPRLPAPIVTFATLAATAGYLSLTSLAPSIAPVMRSGSHIGSEHAILICALGNIFWRSVCHSAFVSP